MTHLRRPASFLLSAAFVLAAAPAWAACGDSVLDDGEACDGGACCTVECTFVAAATECRAAVNPACDQPESCTGDSGDCPADALVDCGDTDGIACTVPTCHEDGTCTEEEECVETCRGAGFWSTHSGDEKQGVNIGQAVLDAAGPLEICGQSVSGTSAAVGSLDSALEGLCVRTRGVKERTLYRQLVTAALNCAISEGGDCDTVVGRFTDVGFDDCNALCAGTPVEDGPSLADCKNQLACFNNGGRVIDGQCALGTCAEAPETLCGDDYGPCPAIDENPQACERFDGNCKAADLCTTELDVAAGICPEKKRATSPKACKAARSNQCTIDACGPM